MNDNKPVWDVVALEGKTLAASPYYPRPGERLSLSIDEPRQPSRVFQIAFAFGNRPGIPLLPRPWNGGTELLPLANDPLLQATAGLGLIGALDSTGKGSFVLGIPPDPSLTWTTFHAAAITLEAGPRIGTITNAVDLQVVR